MRPRGAAPSRICEDSTSRRLGDKPKTLQPAVGRGGLIPSTRERLSPRRAGSPRKTKYKDPHIASQGLFGRGFPPSSGESLPEEAELG